MLHKIWELTVKKVSAERAREELMLSF